MSSADRLRAATVGEPVPLDGRVLLVDYDEAWPAAYAREAARIRAALHDAALLLEHVGSTAVPGLCAKPRIDVLLGVADPAEEAAYVPTLEAAGYRLRIREPWWHQHRMLVDTDPDVNVHVFAAGSPEVRRMLSFRDRLRRDAADRDTYAAAKRTLAARRWAYLQDYADAKSAVVEDILRRASTAEAPPG